MIHIVTDSSPLYDKTEAASKKLHVCPLNITINDQDYTDLDGITSTQLIEKIKLHYIPKTSQPSIGRKIELYNELTLTGEVIDITMASGLSGTYQSAMMAKQSCEHPELVHVIDSKTLCGPHRLIIDTALKMAESGSSAKDIVKMIVLSRETDISFLIPVDFQFLARGGRVKNGSAILGSALKLVPVMKLADKGRGLEKFSVSRTYKRAIETIIVDFNKYHVDASYIFYVTHAFNLDGALKVEARIKAEYEGAKVIILPLSPAFIAQGGPKCVAVQTIKIVD